MFKLVGTLMTPKTNTLVRQKLIAKAMFPKTEGPHGEPNQ
jgi:hypothetical protein